MSTLIVRDRIAPNVSTHDIVIIGGGCIGCSVARSLSTASALDVAVVEKEHHLAVHQSGRNSGVLHPGFNYEPGSLKARFATEGTRRMKTYAAENDVPIANDGVLVVAQSDAEERRLRDLQRQADANGVEAELLRGADAIESYEPHAAGQAALVAPAAASIDAQQYVYSLARDARATGVDFYTDTRVEGVSPTRDGFRLRTSSGRLNARYVVNCAGLHADRVADAFDVGTDLQVIPFRGEYYEVVPDRRELCRSMIYPTPDPELPFLGVHYTRRTDGTVIVGPNAVLALGREAYTNTDVNPRDLVEILGYRGFRRLVSDPKMLRVAATEVNKSYRKTAFVEAARRLVPSLSADDVTKSYAGIRAQLVSADGDLVKDPVVRHTDASTHVLNAVSPGLTCSLPLGDHLADRIIENFEAV
ncbi:L-2-hydroxyglutarate oxidase [Halovivax cerinus]|uniref:L-2-hydroxyglutarate oxidase n=1 Tax=Halovivax cerinus TaxID=1487865 RepID=A0ABD5NKT7_9EURY